MSIKTLHFAEKTPDCILVLQGMAPDPDIFRFFSNTSLIATDGAANEILQIGRIPDIIIGDLDSFDATLLPPNSHTKILCIPDQDKNDFEKALEYCLSQHFEHIVIYGIHGGDFEHSLNNVSVLWKYVDSFTNITILDSLSRIAIPVSSDFSSHAFLQDEIISLIPFPHARLTTQGLEWELQNEVLELSVREGARNRCLSNSLHISVHEGRFLFFCDSRLPALPLFTSYPSSFL